MQKIWKERNLTQVCMFTSDKSTCRKSRFIASVPKSDKVKPIKQRESQKCLTSFNGVKKPNACKKEKRIMPIARVCLKRLR